MLSSFDRAALHFGLDPLEARRMLSVTASVNSSHILDVTGTSGNDTIILNKLSNGKVSVSGVSTQFSTGTTSGKFNRIYINAGNGNDLVQINSNVPYTSSTISGANGNDTLTGGVGADSIDGDNNNDTLDGGGGADLLRGDAGLDTANYSYRTDNLNISLDGVANDGGTNEHDNVQTEEVLGGSGNDILNGSSGDDFLAGGAGKDVIHGNGGDDDITGSTGSDGLFGDAGDDFIQAQNQDVDTVSGGTNPDGSHGLDLASVDPIDVPPAGSGEAAQAAKLSAEKTAALEGAAAAAPPASNPSDLDTNYGDNGMESGPDLTWDSVDSAAIDSQGRIVFVGSASNGNDEDMVATRYNADGTPDTTFGNNGQETIDFSNYFDSSTDDFAHGVAIGPDDSIIIVGSAGLASTDESAAASPTAHDANSVEFAIAKLDNTGTLDSNFGTGGLLAIDLSPSGDDPFNAVARDVAVQADGNIVVAGDTQRENTEVDYDAADDFSSSNNPNDPWSYGYSESNSDNVNLYDTPSESGGLDYWTSSTLASNSTKAPDVQYDSDADQLALEPGFYGERSHVVFTAPVTGSYDVNGEFDGNTSTTTTDVHILVNGDSQFNENIDVAGGEGSQPFSLGGIYLYAGQTIDFEVGYGSDQNFDNDTTALSAEVSRTSAPDDQELAVARVTSTGQLDTSFNFGQGYNYLDVGSDEQASSVALQNLPDDFGAQRIVVGGTSDGNFVVGRFMADGTVDYGFGGGGGYTSNTINNGGALNDIAVDSDNNIYAVGYDENNTSEEPATPSGSNDPSAAVLAKYDSDGNFVDSIEENGGDSEASSAYNAVSIDSMGRILAAGTNGDDYLVGRYDSNLNFDTTFASGPVVVDTTPTGNDSSSNDSALVIQEVANNHILVGGMSYDPDSGDTFTSAARFVGDQQPTNPFDVEQFVDDGDLQNPPPELQTRLDALSPTGLLYVDSQPDANGNVHIDTHNNGVDNIKITTFTAADGTKNIGVTINGVTIPYEVSTTNSITINTEGGADSIIADSSVMVDLIVEAGEGDDVITGGGGRNFLLGQGGNDTINGGAKGDVLIGGAGKDKVYGNDGNDIVIGGPSSDTISGGNGEDILIAGTTQYDSDLDALHALLNEWTSAHSNATRISNLKSGSNGGLNDPYYLSTTGANKTVFDDSAADSLTGGSSRDWFFYKKTGSTKDLLTDSSSSEQFDLM